MGRTSSLPFAGNRDLLRAWTMQGGLMVGPTLSRRTGEVLPCMGGNVQRYPAPALGVPH
jgi:hypothetical protein